MGSHVFCLFLSQFLDEISSNVNKESSGMEDALILKEG